MATASLGWRERVGSVVETGDEIEEERTGDVVEAVVFRDVVEDVVFKSGTSGETIDVTDVVEEMGDEDEVATVGRVKVEEVEETGNGRQETRS